MIAIVNCHGNWFHTQKRGVNGAFLVLTVLQKENLPEATEAPSPAPSAPPRPFPPAQTLFRPLSHLLYLFLKLHLYLVLYQDSTKIPIDKKCWLFQNCSQHCLSVSAPPRVSLSQKRSDGGMKDVLNWTIIEIPKDKQDYLDPIYSPTSRIWNPSHNMSCCNLTLWINSNK